MSENVKMSVEQRLLYILRARLRGSSITEIAQRCSTSRQYICNTYSSLPKRSRKEQAKGKAFHGIPEETICNACYEYITGVKEIERKYRLGKDGLDRCLAEALDEGLYKKINPNAAEEKKKKPSEKLSKATIETICEEYRELLDTIMASHKMTEEQMFACFYAITDRIVSYDAVLDTKLCYGTVNQWRHQNNLSMEGMAKKVGVGAFAFTEMMKGWRFMPYPIAKKICTVTGFPMTVVCGDMVSFRDNTRAERYLSKALDNYSKGQSNASETEALCWTFYNDSKEGMEA